MKTTTFAAAAVFLGSVSADGWESWSSSDSVSTKTPTWTKPVDATTSEDPATWTEWSTTSKTPAATSEDPATWSEWKSSTTSSKPSVPTSSDPATWSEWESAKTSSTTSSKPSVPTSSDPATWSEWESTKTSSTPAAKTSTDPVTWASWDPKTTVTGTSTQWITVTVYPVDGGKTWSSWSDPATVTKTATDSKTVVVSSTVTKTATDASWSAWATPAAPVAVVAAVDPNCKVQISLSYGLPIWYPTPVIATSVNSTSWGVWDSATSSTPAAKTSTDPVTWGTWASTTSSKPATKTSTDPVTWGTWASTTSSKPAAITSTSSASWSSWGAEKAKVVDPSGIASWSAWSSSASATSSSGSAAQTNWGQWAQDGNGISANGNKFGITYSPYTATSSCKSADVVSKDIAAMAAKGFTSVRVYSTDCNTLEYVGAACKANNMKVILGVFISETGISGAQPQVDAIVKWAQWGLVELIVVGNEAVFGQRCSASELAGFIGSSKQAFKAAGYKGAVSTTDELSVWQSQGSAWCDVVDVVTANLYAFFNPNTVAEDAGSFIQAQIGELSKICPGKAVYVMESGWPSAGECNGKACPSPENQKTAIKGIQAAVGAKIVFFSYEDEAWKTPGQFGVEQHWGCGEIFN